MIHEIIWFEMMPISAYKTLLWGEIYFWWKSRQQDNNAYRQLNVLTRIVCGNRNVGKKITNYFSHFNDSLLNKLNPALLIVIFKPVDLSISLELGAFKRTRIVVVEAEQSPLYVTQTKKVQCSKFFGNSLFIDYDAENNRQFFEIKSFCNFHTKILCFEKGST